MLRDILHVDVAESAIFIEIWIPVFNVLRTLS